MADRKDRTAPRRTPRASRISYGGGPDELRPPAVPETLIPDGWTAVDSVRESLQASSRRDWKPGESGGPGVSVVPDRYELRGELGRGSMGIVRSARDRDLQREVAIKTLAPRESEREDAVARFLHEARLAGALEHPNIVPVHELGVLADGVPFFTMRRLGGRTLADVLRAQRRGDPEALARWGRTRLLRVFTQVCLAVEFAHSRGVVHRDIKPANVAVGDFGEVQLIDWGVAERVQTLLARPPDRLGVAGTAGYIAPEQILQQPGARPEAGDVFALGVVLYELLCLRRPIEDRDAEELLVRTASEDPRPPAERGRDVPPELNELCMAALSRDPSRRPASARELADRIEAFLEGARERDRRREEALERVVEGQSLTARFEALRQERAFVAREIVELRRQVRPSDPPERKRPLWNQEDRAKELRKEIADAFGEALDAYASALDRVPDHPEARVGLAHLWWSRFADYEAEGDEVGALSARRRVQQFDDGLFAARIQGDGTLTLLTDPARARARLWTFVERDRRLVPGEERLLGTTPLREVRVPMGSHLVVLEVPGMPPVRYPVRIGRLGHHDGYVRFYTEDEIGEGFVYVPGGPFLARGGQTEFGRPEERREVVLPDFAIARFPVTFRQYLEFLDALPDERAREHVPRTRLEGPLCRRAPGGRWSPLYDQIFDGAIREVYPDPEVVWDLPAVGVSWHDAAAWCAWRSERTGEAIRLPTETEWEKAARGVDGRAFPWGDAYDPAFANWTGSRPSFSQLEPVGTYPFDESVYGVRDMAGGVANWCGNWFHRDQGSRPYRGNTWMTQGRRSLAERQGTLPATAGGSIGFRPLKALRRR